MKKTVWITAIIVNLLWLARYTYLTGSPAEKLQAIHDRNTVVTDSNRAIMNHSLK